MRVADTPQARDPFAEIPAAQASECELRRRAFPAPEKTVGLVGKPRRKKVDLNPVQRRWFEKEGWTYARVESANAWGGMVCDLWGCADYLACRPPNEIVLVQVTTADNAAARLRKAKKAPELHAWLASGGRYEVHAWRQSGGKGSRWEMQVRPVKLEDTLA